MNKVSIADIFLGDYPITQYFGLNEAVYKRFGLKGHNGLDFGLPLLTPIFSGVDGVVSRVANDPDGYGLYVQVWDKSQSVVLLFAHLNKVFVSEKMTVSKYQMIALSGNSGFTTGPHLHFGVYIADATGQKLYPTNGYAGYVDPLNIRRFSWVIRDPQGVFANHFSR